MGGIDWLTVGRLVPVEADWVGDGLSEWRGGICCPLLLMIDVCDCWLGKLAGLD